MADLNDIINTIIAEANGEGPEGMRWVGETILNRSAIRGLSPGQIVRQPNQYAGYYAPGPLAVQAQQDPRVRTAAEAAWELAKQPGDPTNGADHYHANYVSPNWANSMPQTGTQGDHIFYRSRAVPADALAALLTPQTRDVAFPRSRPTVRDDVALPRSRPQSPSEQIAALFGGSFSAPRDPVTGSGLDRYVARQQAVTDNLTAPGGVDRYIGSMTQKDSLADALANMFAPRSVPAMPTGVAQNFAGQDGLRAERVQQIADVFGAGGDTGAKVDGQVLATIPATNIGRPPTTRVVQSVPVSTAKAPSTPKQTSAQIRADNGQTRQASTTQRPTALTVGAVPNFAAQERAVPSKVNDIGAAPAFSDLAMMFGSTPQASSSVNAKKEQERLPAGGSWTVSEDERMAMHGLTPPPQASINGSTAQVPLPRRRPDTPQKTQVAVTQPRKSVPTNAVTQPRIAAPQIAPKAAAAVPPLRVVVQGGNYSAPRPVTASTKINALRAQGLSSAAAYEALNAAARGAPSLEDRITGRANRSDGTAQSISG